MEHSSIKTSISKYKMIQYVSDLIIQDYMLSLSLLYPFCRSGKENVKSLVAASLLN